MKKFIKNIILLIIILLSGSPYWSNYRAELYIVVVVLLGIYFFVYKIKIDFTIRNIYISIILSGILLLQTILKSTNMPEYTEIVIIIINIFIIMILMILYSRDEFIKITVKIITILSLVSIICFILIQFNIVSTLPLTQTVINGNQILEITPYYTTGWGYVLNGQMFYERNSGLYWEPGAWQAISNIALLLLICNKNLFTNYKTYLTILVLTILTTQSTTGYISLLLIVLVFGRKYFRNYKTILIAIIMMIFCTCFLLSSDVIRQKLFNQEGSYNTRLNDTIGSLEIVSKNPILGVGYNSMEYKKRAAKLNIVNNSNGLLLGIVFFGLLFNLVYYYYFISNVKYYFTKNKIEIYTIIFIFFIIHSTEWFLIKLFFIALLFKTKTIKELEQEVDIDG